MSAVARAGKTLWKAVNGVKDEGMNYEILKRGPKLNEFMNTQTE